MSHSKNSASKPNWFDWLFYTVLILAYAVSLTCIVGYVVYTWDYLVLPVEERPFHPKHALIKPGGLWGHGFGIIGSCMMIVMHVYSLRKRFKMFRGWGSLKKWLHFHIYLGVIGSLLVMVHSTGKAHGLVALSFWSMVLVFLSGFVGRFFYGAIPRRATGLAYSLDEAADISEEWGHELKRRFARIGDAAKQIDGLETRSQVQAFLAKYVQPFSSFSTLQKLNGPGLTQLRLIWGLNRQMIREMQEHQGNDISWKYFLKARRTALKRRERYSRRTVQTLRKTAGLKRKVQRWKSIQARLYYWHVFHKPLSVIMYAILFVHVYIAVKYGFVWIF
jgi:hypothetical protein